MWGADAFTWGCVVVGALLVFMSVSHSYVARLPLSAAMLYLLVGAAMGPAGLGLLTLDPQADAVFLERLTEAAVVVSLFVAGMKLDLPLRDRRWRVPLRLATLSMLLTVGAITAVGMWLLDLPLGLAALLGGILAPTDPVLASEVQLTDAGDRDRLRFGLTGEGGLNDGTAFPFVMLGLGLMGLHELGAGAWRWWAVDVVWATLAGLGIGWLLGCLVGSLVGKLVIHLRHQRREAWDSDEFIALGLIALVYGVALWCKGYGFLAVFSAGLALGRQDRQARDLQASGSDMSARPPDEPSPMAAVQRFNVQLERVAEVAVVLTVGLLLTRISFTMEVVWLLVLLVGVIRPVAVWCGLRLGGRHAADHQLALTGWFGIRGVGSIYYLMYALNHGVEGRDATLLSTITLSAVVTSAVLHGISVTPLMSWYARRGRRR